MKQPYNRKATVYSSSDPSRHGSKPIRILAFDTTVESLDSSILKRIRLITDIPNPCPTLDDTIGQDCNPGIIKIPEGAILLFLWYRESDDVYIVRYYHHSIIGLSLVQQIRRRTAEKCWNMIGYRIRNLICSFRISP